MTTLMARLRVVVGAFALLAFATLSFPALAQQPQQQGGPVNPTARAVKEEQLLQQFNRIEGRGTIPDTKSYLIEQPTGRDWRQFHEVTLRWIGALSILGILAALVVFYLWRGMVRIDGGRSGRTIVRFNGFERFVHWTTASCFIVLAISGLNITFGKTLLLPLIGASAFSTWSVWAKLAHNYLSFPFTFVVILIFLMWMAGNIPNRTDVEWLKRRGGMIGHDHPPAGRFNAGQKAIYWIVVLGGSAVAITGYILMFPFYGTGIYSMQTAEVVHSIVAMLFIAAMLGHIYIGTIGMEGAFEAMGRGTVDVNWAKEHHSLWLDEEMTRSSPGRPAPRRTAAE